MPTFEGFPPDALGLLGALPMGNRDWYRASKREIDTALLNPAKALVEALGERLRSDLSPTFEAQPKVNGSISPLNEDLRFAPNKPPYRDYLMLNFWDGAPKKLANANTATGRTPFRTTAMCRLPRPQQPAAVRRGPGALAHGS